MQSRSISAAAAAAAPASSAGSMNSSGWPSKTVSPGATRTSHDAAHRRGDHVLHLHRLHHQQLLAGAHRLAFGATSTDTMVPCIGAGTASGRPVRRARSGAASAVAARGAPAVVQHRERIDRATRRRQLRPAAATGPAPAGEVQRHRPGRACEQRGDVLVDEAGVGAAVRTSGWRSRACRKPMLVATPPMRNSASARSPCARRAAASPAGEWTITLASSESKRGLVR
jgi:hypothetical protein